MPASETSSRRSSMAAEVQGKPAVNILEPGVRQVHTLSASSKAAVATSRKSMSVYARSNQAGQSEIPNPMASKIGNTYKLGPDQEKRFRCKDVKEVIDCVLEDQLKGLPYDAEKCKSMLPAIADEIKDKVKVLGFERFKLVCIVTIGQLNNQGVRVASRGLWDSENDRMATSSYCGNDLFATAAVFGVYRE